MQRVTKRLLSIALLFIAALLLVSCATGSKFQKTDKIPEGMGLVYIYRPAIRTAALISSEVEANGVGIIKLINGGYYPYFSKPGEVEFSAKVGTGSAVTIYVEAGQTYYIKGTIWIDFFVPARPNLTIVPPEVGANEIIGCKLLEK
jgi:hypothetical protein